MILAFVTAVASLGGGDLPVNADRSAHGVVPMPHAQGSHPPLVSIVLPAFVTGEHEARTLDETLASLDAQSCSDIEVVVVDDGSPVEVARLVARHPRTFTVRQPNAGPAVARNTGIDVSRGSSFLFIDVGDQLLPSTIERGLAVLDAQPGAGFVAGACESIVAPDREIPGIIARHWTSPIPSEVCAESWPIPV